MTLSFSRQSRVTPEHARGLALGVIGACTVLLPRVLTVTLLLSPPVARQLLAYLIAPAIVGGCILIYVLLREEPAPAGGTAPDPGNPLRLGTALQMALAFQVVLLVVPAAERLGGRAVCWAPAALLGLTDMDALTYSMSRLGATTGDAGLAARAIAIGMLSNTVLSLSWRCCWGPRPSVGWRPEGLWPLP